MPWVLIVPTNVHVVNFVNVDVRMARQEHGCSQGRDPAETFRVLTFQISCARLRVMTNQSTRNRSKLTLRKMHHAARCGALHRSRASESDVNGSLCQSGALIQQIGYGACEWSSRRR